MRRMAYTIVFRIRKEYFDQIVAGKKTREVRALKPFWDIRAESAQIDLHLGRMVLSTFLCGQHRHHREIVDVRRYETAAEALGREPSEQGRQDLGDGPVWGFDLGKVV